MKPNDCPDFSNVLEKEKNIEINLNDDKEILRIIQSNDLLEISKLYKQFWEIFIYNIWEWLNQTSVRYIFALFDNQTIKWYLKLILNSPDFLDASINFVEWLHKSWYKFGLDFKTKIIAKLIVENKYWPGCIKQYWFEDDIDILDEKVMLFILNNINENFENSDNRMYLKILSFLKDFNFQNRNLSKEFFETVLNMLWGKDFNEFISMLFYKYPNDKKDLLNIIPNLPQGYWNFAQLYYFYQTKNHKEWLKYLDEIHMENYSNEFQNKFFALKIEFLRKSWNLLDAYWEIYYQEKINEKVDYNIGLSKWYVLMELGEGERAYDVFLNLWKELYLNPHIEWRRTRLFTGIMFNYQKNNYWDKKVLSTCYQILLDIKEKNWLNPTEKERVNKAIEIYDLSFENNDK